MADKVDLPRKSYLIEFWVGVFSIIGMLSFSYLCFNIAGIKLSNSNSYSIIAKFSNVAGLKSGAGVEIAGVKIGSVQSITLDDIQAVVRLNIDKNNVIREDDIAQIRTKGIIGDKYVKISPGGAEETLTDGSYLIDTESAIEFEELVGKFVHSMNKDE